jgi:gluconate 2-dehydrogenase gamma chain
MRGKISPAKAQRRKALPRFQGFFFAPLRLCGRKVNPMNSQLIRSVVDCLIPADDFPGAYDAGVCDYLLKLFETDLRAEAKFFTAGLESIDLEARARFGEPFANLTPAQQTITLDAIEQGDVLTSWQISPQRFFEMLVCTTAEGFYSEPQQGGNRGAISWTMTGFEDQDS